MKTKSLSFFNRRYATDHCINDSYPALKGRAKFTLTLRVRQSEVFATFEAELLSESCDSESLLVLMNSFLEVARLWFAAIRIGSGRCGL